MDKAVIMKKILLAHISMNIRGMPKKDKGKYGVQNFDITVRVDGNFMKIVLDSISTYTKFVDEDTEKEILSTFFGEMMVDGTVNAIEKLESDIRNKMRKSKVKIDFENGGVEQLLSLLED